MTNLDEPGHDHRGGAHSHPTVAPENSTTFCHLATSAAITLPKSAGVPPIGAPPRSASRATIFGSLSASLTVLLSFSITSAGVPFGTPMPNQDRKSVV